MNRKSLAAVAATLLTATYTILPAFAFSDLAKINQTLPSASLQRLQQESAASGDYSTVFTSDSSLADLSANSNRTVIFAANGVPQDLAGVMLSTRKISAYRMLAMAFLVAAPLSMISLRPKRHRMRNPIRRRHQKKKPQAKLKLMIRGQVMLRLRTPRTSAQRSAMQYSVFPGLVM